jgi:hypothetical protein
VVEQPGIGITTGGPVPPVHLEQEDGEGSALTARVVVVGQLPPARVIPQ